MSLKTILFQQLHLIIISIYKKIDKYCATYIINYIYHKMYIYYAQFMLINLSMKPINIYINSVQYYKYNVYNFILWEEGIDTNYIVYVFILYCKKINICL